MSWFAHGRVRRPSLTKREVMRGGEGENIAALLDDINKRSKTEDYKLNTTQQDADIVFLEGVLNKETHEDDETNEENKDYAIEFLTRIKSIKDNIIIPTPELVEIQQSLITTRAELDQAKADILKENFIPPYPDSIRRLFGLNIKDEQTWREAWPTGKFKSTTKVRGKTTTTNMSFGPTWKADSLADYIKKKEGRVTMLEGLEQAEIEKIKAKKQPKPTSSPSERSLLTINNIDEWVISAMATSHISKLLKPSVAKDSSISPFSLNGAFNWDIIEIKKDYASNDVSLYYSILVDCSINYRKISVPNRRDLAIKFYAENNKTFSSLAKFSDLYHIGIVLFVAKGENKKPQEAYYINNANYSQAILLYCYINIISSTQIVRFSAVRTSFTDYVIPTTRIEKTTGEDDLPIKVTFGEGDILRKVIGEGVNIFIPFITEDKTKEELVEAKYLNDDYKGEYTNLNVLVGKNPTLDTSIIQHIRNRTYKKNNKLNSKLYIEDSKKVDALTNDKVKQRLSQFINISAFGEKDADLQKELDKRKLNILKKRQLMEGIAEEKGFTPLEHNTNYSDPQIINKVLNYINNKIRLEHVQPISTEYDPYIQDLSGHISTFVKNPDSEIHSELVKLKEFLKKPMSGADKAKLKEHISTIEKAGEYITKPYKEFKSIIGQSKTIYDTSDIPGSLWRTKQKDRLQRFKINENKIASGVVRPGGWSIELYDPQTGKLIGDKDDPDYPEIVKELTDQCNEFTKSQLAIKPDPLGKQYGVKTSTTMYDFMKLLFLKPEITLDEMVSFYFRDGRPNAGCDSYETLARLFVFFGGVNTLGVQPYKSANPQEGGDYIFVEKIELNGQGQYTPYFTSWDMFRDTQCLATKGSGISDISLFRKDIVDPITKKIKEITTHEDQIYKKIYLMSVKWFQDEKSPESYDISKLQVFPIASFNDKVGILVFLKSRSRFTEKCVGATRTEQLKYCEHIYGWEEDVKPFLDIVRGHIFKIADDLHMTPIQAFDEVYTIFKKYRPSGPPRPIVTE